MKNNYESILKKYWGFDGFRGIQREIIESIGAGHDTLGLMPTGGGKSITFQVPALATDGVCIVVTPLIALMKDQVQNLRRRNIRAAAIYSGMSHSDILITLENAVFGGVKILYVSPERLSSELFQTKLQHMTVSFICVDEAHCISQWGYDFRPSYLAIADIRKIVHVPVLALTATATPTVIKDIQEKLTADGTPFNVFRMSFERKNLAYIVRTAEDKQEEMLHILKNVPGSAIVYTRSRQRTKETSEWLCQMGQDATYFHAGLDHIEKDRRQKDWQAGKTRIMVATNAFGMGIDKPDVRIVIHIDCPSSIEAYFQEAGRAGRDGAQAYAVLLYNNSDRQKLEKRVKDTFPEKDYIRQVYDDLAYTYQIAIGSGYNSVHEFNRDKFCHIFKHFPIQVESALHILTRAGYIDYTEEQEYQARVMFTLGRDELYRLENNSGNEEKVIVALLRNYSGLFSEYQYIDEAWLAMETSLEKPIVYETLMQLARKHILQFIPQKRTPYIKYTQRREESKNLYFPPESYELLKQRYTERIHAMLSYVTTDNQCRSRQLLRYFGETRSHDCGTCDVCRQEQKDKRRKEAQSAEELLLQWLSDGKRHLITELHQMSSDYEAIEAALRHLTEEERVYVDGPYLIKN